VKLAVDWRQKVFIASMIKEKSMEYDRNKVDDAVLALLYLNFLGDQNEVRPGRVLIGMQWIVCMKKDILAIQKARRNQ
jgi:hypothetical protein